MREKKTKVKKMRLDYSKRTKMDRKGMKEAEKGERNGCKKIK